MAKPRTELQDILTTIVGVTYFQPPENVHMTYPCVVYNRDRSENNRADNLLYNHTKRYQVTIIDRDPDSALPDQVEALPMCELERWFAADGLNHWVFNLYF